MVKDKFTNPADRARRLARDKEKRKNKKQRQLVRDTIIKERDPEQILAELEKLDTLEYDAVSSNSRNICFKDKRRRLRESWDRILSYYLKDDPERHSKLKRLESEYEFKHKRLTKEIEAIQAAREVKLEDVVMPPESDPNIFEISDDDPLLSKSIYLTVKTEGPKPPGCPPGVPPDLQELVNNLKTTLNESISQIPKHLPKSLIQRSQKRLDIAKHRARNFEGAHNKSGFDRHTKFNRTEPNSVSAKVTCPKTAIIESKPVLFKSKAIEMIPSSVRSKLKTKTIGE